MAKEGKETDMGQNSSGETSGVSSDAYLDHDGTVAVWLDGRTDMMVGAHITRAEARRLAKRLLRAADGPASAAGGRPEGSDERPPGLRIEVGTLDEGTADAAVQVNLVDRGTGPTSVHATWTVRPADARDVAGLMQSKVYELHACQLAAAGLQAFEVLTPDAAGHLGWSAEGTRALDRELSILRGPPLSDAQQGALTDRILSLAAGQAGK